MTKSLIFTIISGIVGAVLMYLNSILDGDGQSLTTWYGYLGAVLFAIPLGAGLIKFVVGIFYWIKSLVKGTDV